MTQPQQQKNTRGQVLDESRGIYRTRSWPGVLTKWTLTLAGFGAGTYSFKINGILIEYEATGGDDANTSIAGLKAKFEATPGALKLAVAVIDPATPNVLRLNERSAGDGFSITDTVADVGTLTAADITNERKRLGLGVGIAFVGDDPSSIREMQSGDAAANLRGITVENALLAPNSGDGNDEDGYDQGSPVTYIEKGLVPVPIEGDLVTNIDTNQVWMRINSPGTEETGVWAIADGGGGNWVQILNAKWNDLGYYDEQGRPTADLNLNP